MRDTPNTMPYRERISWRSKKKLNEFNAMFQCGFRVMRTTTDKLKAIHSFNGNYLIQFWKEDIFKLLDFALPKESAFKEIQDKRVKFTRLIETFQLLLSFVRLHRLLTEEEITTVKNLGIALYCLLQEVGL